MPGDRITYERALREAQINSAEALMRIADALEKIVTHLTTVRATEAAKVPPKGPAPKPMEKVNG